MEKHEYFIKLQLQQSMLKKLKKERLIPKMPQEKKPIELNNSRADTLMSQDRLSPF